MSLPEPAKLWWSADELAGSGLPDLPGTRQGVKALAKRESWNQVPNCSRIKKGRGGGIEYHWSVLPKASRLKLLAHTAPAPDTRPNRGEAWATFASLPSKTKEDAAIRLKAIQDVEAMCAAGSTHMAAVSHVARSIGVATRTMYNWLSMIEGVAIEDRLAYLPPRHKLATRKAPDASKTKPFMDYLKSVYMQLEAPTFKQAYRTVMKKALIEGWETLKERTASRRIEKEVPRVTMVFAREGVSGLMRCFPAQIRDRAGLSAMEAVNADCHKIDVFVSWPDGTVTRPQIIAFQDLFSNKILSWRVDHDPNKVMVMSAFGELVENFGIPKHCLFDNGHEFANKWMTAGTATRFRFKVREDDPLGVLPLMGIQIHWATPAHGQAKPIERGFRDFASDIAKDPRFHGAYVGNKPTAKPENYGERAVPVEKFLQVVEEGIIEHNARQGRLSDTANGRSFDDTFNESYAKAPIRKATEEQRRLWMMGQHVGNLNSRNGQLRIYGNWYFSDWMTEHVKRRVVARFDPEDLHAGVHIYDIDGSYLGFAECRQKVGFFDLASARATARRNAGIKRAQKALTKALAPIPIQRIAADLEAMAPVATATPESKVVAPKFGGVSRGLPSGRKPYEITADAEVEAAQEALILQMKQPELLPKDHPQSAADRFWWAQGILSKSESGQPIGTEEAKRVKEYMKTPEYQTQLQMFESYGADGVG